MSSGSPPIHLDQAQIRRKRRLVTILDENSFSLDWQLLILRNMVQEFQNAVARGLVLAIIPSTPTTAPVDDQRSILPPIQQEFPTPIVEVPINNQLAQRRMQPIREPNQSCMPAMRRSLTSALARAGENYVHVHTNKPSKTFDWGKFRTKVNEERPTNEQLTLTEDAKKLYFTGLSIVEAEHFEDSFDTDHVKKNRKGGTAKTSVGGRSFVCMPANYGTIANVVGGKQEAEQEWQCQMALKSRDQIHAEVNGLLKQHKLFQQSDNFNPFDGENADNTTHVLGILTDAQSHAVQSGEKRSKKNGQQTAYKAHQVFREQLSMVAKYLNVHIQDYCRTTDGKFETTAVLIMETNIPLTPPIKDGKVDPSPPPSISHHAWMTNNRTTHSAYQNVESTITALLQILEHVDTEKKESNKRIFWMAS